MPTSSDLYLTTLLQALHQHPLTRHESAGYQHWADLIRDVEAECMPLVKSAEVMAGNGASFQESSASNSLEALFATIGTINPSATWYIPPVVGNISKTFPVTQKPGAASNVWLSDFRKECKAAPKHSDTKQAAEQLLFLLEKCCVNVPSGYHPALSFYDFTKMWAAAAICMGHEGTTTGSPFILVSGGVSGIQDYLYDILSRKASRNLKGRSFFLQLLADTVMMEILDKLGLFRTNVVYSSGSGFLVLAPNTPENQRDLERLKLEISRRLFAEFNTKLFLELEWQELTNLQPESLDAALKAIHRNISNSKKRKFSDILLSDGESRIVSDERPEPVNGYDYFFDPLPINGEESTDAVTNEEIFRGWELLDPEDETTRVKPLTKAQAEMGRHLQDTDVLVTSLNGLPVNDKWKQIAPINSAVRHHLFDFREAENAFAQKSYPGIMFSFGLEDVSERSIPAVVKGFMLYAGNKVPVYESDFTDGPDRYKRGQPKVFEHLADDGKTRFKRLGVLRMDVDGLGSTFQQIFSAVQNPRFPRTLAGYSALSRNLDYFFKGYLNELWNNTDEYRQFVQITYAGGDDLFVVGKWDAVVRMAEEIREDFRKWTCSNPAFGLSGGVVLVTPKFPIIKAAQAAGEALDQAKDHETGEGKKDAFTLFGAPLRWKSEFAEVRYLKEQMAALSNDGLLPRGFFSKIQALHDQADFQKEKERTEAWRWRIAYDFSRMKERKRGNERLHSFLDELIQSVLTNRRGKEFISDPQSHHYFVLVNLAAQWADFETRVSNELPS